MTFPILTALLLPNAAAGAFTCSDDCDAGGSTDICTIDVVGADSYWVCDTKIAGDTTGATVNYETGEDSGTVWMATYGTAGDGSDFCCYTETVVAKILLWGTNQDDTLQLHDGTANESFLPNHAAGTDCFVKAWGRDGIDTIETADAHSGDIFWELYGNDGADYLYARNSTGSVASQVTLQGGPNGDYLYGSAGDDTILGGAGDDYAYGDDGDDAIKGGGGVDRLFGEGGDDSIWGEAGDDFLMGGGGDDILRGGDDDDSICGEAGTYDTLFGESGDDILYDPASSSAGHAGPASDSDSCDGDGTYVNCDDPTETTSPCPAP